jgi:RNA polymerase sigma-70 factor (ECF subfamily)
VVTIVNDSEIIELFLARNENAIEKAREKYFRYCVSISTRILKSKEDSEECLNDALLNLWNTIPPTRPENLGVFLGTIVRRLALNRQKAQKRQKRSVTLALTELSEIADILPDNTADNPEEVAVRGALTSAINSFLNTLSLQDSNVFVRRYYHMRTVREVADDLGLSVTNTKQILFRTRNKLKEYLEKEGVM